MAERTTWRIPIRINIKIFYKDEVYSGVVKNLSQKGMFIDTKKMCFPEKSEFSIEMPVNDEELHMPGRLIRLVKVDGGCDGIGIELLNPPKKYLDFVENLLYVL